MKDPFVEEVRRYRMEHSKKLNFDIHAICDDLRKYQEHLCRTHDIDNDRKYVHKSLTGTGRRAESIVR